MKPLLMIIALLLGTPVLANPTSCNNVFKAETTKLEKDGYQLVSPYIDRGYRAFLFRNNSDATVGLTFVIDIYKQKVLQIYKDGNLVTNFLGTCRSKKGTKYYIYRSVPIRKKATFTP